MDSKKKKGGIISIMEVLVVISDSPDGIGERVEIVTQRGRLFSILGDKIIIQDERKKEGIIIPSFKVE